MKNSNINVHSNIYVLKEKIYKDKEFMQKVFDRDALKKIKSRTSYGSYNQFTEKQKIILSESFECALNIGVEVWGLIKENGDLNIKCRCEKKECKNFSNCRPNYEEKRHEKVEIEDSEKQIEEKSEDNNSLNYYTIRDEVFEAKTEDRRELDATDYQKITRRNKSEKILKETSAQKTTSKEKQKRVIEALPTEEILVDAAPGTGKTYTLIKRIRYLIEECKIEPLKILVLCFSRAAVSEIRNRLNEVIENNEVSMKLNSLQIRTFDSFATYFLAENDVENFANEDYEGRIRLVTEKIQKWSKNFGDIVEHFIVDEIQDLVGARAKMVKTIIKTIKCGFTLLGDSCQAIFGWQINDNNEMDSDDLYNWIKDSYRNKLLRVEYEQNHRQSSKLKDISKEYRKIILDSSVDLQDKNEKVKKIINTIEPVGPGYKIPSQIINAKGNKAFLCRSNGEVLMLSSLFHNQQIEHSIVRSASSKRIKPWLGTILGEVERDVLSKEDFEQSCLSKVQERKEKYAYKKWSVLKDIEQGRSRSRLDLRRVVSNLFKERGINNSLYKTYNKEIVISTIHRAKGKEYDNVILLNKLDETWVKRNNEIEELRVYYVALTRPRNNIYTTYINDLNGVKKANSTEDARHIYKRNNNLSLIEVGNEKDIDVIGFIDINLFGDVDSVFKNQKYIRNEINEGDEVILKKEIIDRRAVYYIYHKDRLIGKMSRYFTRAISRIYREIREENFISAKKFPFEIHELYIDDIVTLIRDVNYKSNIPEIYKKNKMWNGIMINGFGRIAGRYN